MKLPRDWNGLDLAEKLSPLGFTKVRQSGSHILLRHVESGEVISIPAHRPLKIGTLAALLRDVSELTGISREELIKKLQK